MKKRIYNKIIMLTILVVISIITLLFFNLLSGKVKAQDSAPKVKYFKSIEIMEDDTLWSIAECHISIQYSSMQDYIEEVKKINNIKGDRIHQGCYLTVPYYEK